MVAVHFDQRVMCEAGMKIIVTGRNAGTAGLLAVALAKLGAEVVTADKFEIKPREVFGAWRDPAIALERHRSYGPAVKGRGGKVKRW